MSVNDKMKAIADAIRAHTGGTDALTLDAMAAAIASIEAGGGGGAKIAFGTITPSANTTELTLEHNLGVKPQFVHVFLPAGYTAASRANGLRTFYAKAGDMLGGGDAYVSGTSASSFTHDSTACSCWEIDETKAKATQYYANGNAVNFLGGKRYLWICVAADGLEFQL